jgi:hypothetical protein
LTATALELRSQQANACLIKSPSKCSKTILFASAVVTLGKNSELRETNYTKHNKYIYKAGIIYLLLLFLLL